MTPLINFNSKPVKTTLDILLEDKTTNENIILATETYPSLEFQTPITKDLLKSKIIEIYPRIQKNKKTQNLRTKKKAEVFTPAWICNTMNNICDTEWFGKQNVFNIEKEHDWQTTPTPITFPKNKTWQDYLTYSHE